jgi:hypothetical protein
MSPEVTAFLARCRRDGAAVSPVKILFAEFNNGLAGHKGKWSRTNFVMELARAGFTISEFANCDCVAGLAPPTGAWQSRNGRLAFAEVA